jgi:hypothetical protein
MSNRSVAFFAIESGLNGHEFYPRNRLIDFPTREQPFSSV